MQHPNAGFTLVEVLIAASVITLGAVALLASLTASAALAGDGHRMARSAVVLASRADLLRARVRAAAPACTVPLAGTAQAPGGILESWQAARRGEVVDVLVETVYFRARRLRADTLVTAVPCP